jgi:phage-related minor tail protein
MHDSNAMGLPDSSGLVGAKDALAAFSDAANDAAKVMQEIVTSTLGDINKTLLNDITGTRKRGEWTSVGHTLATSVAGGALKKGEASILGSLGLGSKSAPKGTSGDPLHVIVANPTGTAGSMGMSSDALGKLLGSGSTAKSPAGGLISSLLPLIPGFANGGAISAGTLAMVGERGPELVKFGSAAHITPNNKLGSLGGTSHTWNIDARGSTNPAETMAMVQKGILEAAPHIVAASIKAGRDQNSRSAPSARR